MSQSPRPEHSKLEVVLGLLRAASNGQAIPAEGHVIDDEETLACWEAGLLTPQQRAQIVAHLADCPRCRHELAAMVRRGELQWVQTEAEVSAVPAADRRRSVRTWLSLAVAASLLVAVGLLGWQWWRPGGAGGIAPRSALALRGKITDYGYLLDGQSAAKGFTPPNTVLESQRKQLLAAIQERPASRSVRLAYGKLLLRLDEPADAGKVFAPLVEADPRDPAARLGLGLARFLEGRFADALAEFTTVLQLDPGNLAAKLNAAACLAQLGRAAEAESYWNEVLAQTEDKELRTQIEHTLRLAREPQPK